MVLNQNLQEKGRKKETKDWKTIGDQHFFLSVKRFI